MGIGKEPEMVVPRLIECLDTFEEYDSDYCYHGEHERVRRALRGFARAAAAAVPSLIQHVWTRPQQRSDESLLLRCSTLHLGVAPADRAPVPVIGHWHAAFDADAHALCGFRGFRRKQAPEKRHSYISGSLAERSPYGPARGRVTRFQGFFMRWRLDSVT